MGGRSEHASYSFEARDKTLVFRTPFFRAERGSVLHTGIYNRELASSLAAGAMVVVFFLILFSRGVEMTTVSLAPAILIFAGLAILFRMTLFYERSLKAVMDKDSGAITINKGRLIGGTDIYPLNALLDVERGHIVFTPENPDGIRVVEKVAAQHGTVTPGLGEAKEFYTVELAFKDGWKTTVFASGDRAEAEEVRERFRSFIIA